MNKNPLDSVERFVSLLDAPEPSLARLVTRRDRRRRRRQLASGAGAAAVVGGLAAAMVWVLPIGTDPSPESTQLAAADGAATAAATTDPAVVAPATSEPAAVEPVPQAPVRFTACNVDVGEPSVGRSETITIPDGGGLVRRDRGEIIPQVMSDVSDPRLDGTWSLIFNQDEYTSRQGSANIVTVVLRIENNEGAWQGDDTIVRVADVDSFLFHLMMTGEGAYEGLTAAMAYGVVAGEADRPCTNVRGYILGLGAPDTEGTFPAP